jgi:hypothetical protein
MEDNFSFLIMEDNFIVFWKWKTTLFWFLI